MSKQQGQKGGDRRLVSEEVDEARFGVTQTLVEVCDVRNNVAIQHSLNVLKQLSMTSCHRLMMPSEIAHLKRY